MNVSIQEEDPASEQARALVEELETVLAELYPAQSRHGLNPERLAQADVQFHVLRCDGRPAGCGGIQWCQDYGEIKRIYVRPQFRGQRLAEQLLLHLEQLARQRGVALLRLETGIHQMAAIRLYQKLGYQSIPAFGPYREDPLSLCYEKVIAG